MSKVTISKLKPTVEYLSQTLDLTDSLLLQIKLSKVISAISSYFNSAAPIGLIVESYKRRYEGSRLDLKMQELLESEIDYDGPLLTLDEVSQLPSITADYLETIDFLIKDW